MYVYEKFATKGSNPVANPKVYNVVGNNICIPDDGYVLAAKRRKVLDSGETASVIM